MLARPNYITYTDTGAIDNIFCKQCGAPIAGFVSVPVTTKTRGIRWRRFPNYAEIKMQFDDGHYHVTNGCKACLNLGLPANTLWDMYAADMTEMKITTDPDIAPMRVVAMDTTGVGIL